MQRNNSLHKLGDTILNVTKSKGKFCTAFPIFCYAFAPCRQLLKIRINAKDAAKNIYIHLTR